MANQKQQPSALVLGMGVAMVALWPSCGGKSIVTEEEPDEPDIGGTGVGAETGGGVAGTSAGGQGGASVRGGAPSGGVGAAPRGGVGAAPGGGGVAPSGGTPAGGAAGVGLGGVGVAGVGFGGAAGDFAGVAGIGFGGVGVAGTLTGGIDAGGVAGVAGRGRGLGMGGRFGGAGVGGRMGGRGMGGRGFGGGGTGGFGAIPIDGFTFLTPCQTSPMTGRTCRTVTTMSCGGGEPLPGYHPTDVTMRMPGTPGVFYDLLVRFQGLVDTKAYSGGVDQDGYATLSDGMYTGGVPVADAGTIYLVRVASPARDYFLNSLVQPMSQPTNYPFVVDYRAIIRVEGGTLVRLVSADADCEIIRNCLNAPNQNACYPFAVSTLVPTISDDVEPQPYDGQFIGMVVDAVSIVL